MKKTDPKSELIFTALENLAKKQGIKSTRCGAGRWLRLEAGKRKKLEEINRLKNELNKLEGKR